LGEAFIKASKNWYKGGYIKFLFESKKLKKNNNFL
ncbi:alpha-2,3-sialyltransferase, partial [Campylobacter jejuni]